MIYHTYGLYFRCKHSSSHVLHVFELVLVSSTKVLNMDDTELQKSVCRQPSLKNLTQVDYGKPKPQQNKVRTCELNIQFAICLFPTFHLPLVLMRF